MEYGPMRSFRGRAILLLAIVSAPLFVHAEEIDLQTEIVTAPTGADPGDIVSFTMSYSNASGTDAENARVRLILPAGVFLNWSSLDMQEVAASVVDTFGYTGVVEFDEDSCDNVLVSIIGGHGSPPLIPANGGGQFSVEIQLPEDIPSRGVFMVNSPQSVAGYYDFTVGRCDSCDEFSSCFGGPLSQMTPASADLELVNDPSGADPSEGCHELEGFTQGNIALVRRGTCGFGVKAVNAQIAGASGVVIINNTADVNIHSFTMSGGLDGAQVTLPVVLIGKEDGDLLIDTLDAKTAVHATLGGVEEEELIFVSTAFHAPNTDTDASGLNDSDLHITEVNYILEEPPVAAFGHAPETPVKGQPVQFTDLSTDDPTSWSWDFGDGVGTSDEQDPTYTYTSSGIYTVALTATNAHGSDDHSDDVSIGELIVGSDDYFIPTAAFAEGAEGSFFVTDVEINNAGATSMAYQFVWLPRGENNSVPQISLAYMLGPGKSARYENILSSVFGLEDGTGAVGLVCDSADALLMTRTYNRVVGEEETSTFGQGMEGIPRSGLIPTSVTKRILYFSQNDEFRSNLGCQNGNNSALSLLADMYAPDGTFLETMTINLPPFSNKQFNRLFKDYAPIVGGYVDVRSEQSGAAFMCYGSVLDNVSSDPTTVMPQ